tara:strand:+ start:1475 stop:1873 length:399 start_codon:yes stop_codon:yes gene_type:complete
VDSINSSPDLKSLIALAADHCFKPYKHSVLALDNIDNLISFSEVDYDICIVIQCRNLDGIRITKNDLELEIYSSGKDINVMLSFINNPDMPIVWHGRHSVWMDPDTGKLCKKPANGIALEALIRRIKALFSE